MKFAAGVLSLVEVTVGAKVAVMVRWQGGAGWRRSWALMGRVAPHNEGAGLMRSI